RRPIAAVASQGSSRQDAMMTAETVKRPCIRMVSRRSHFTVPNDNTVSTREASGPGNRSVMAGRARHSVRAGLGSRAYEGAHGVTRPTFPAVTEALPDFLFWGCARPESVRWVVKS